MQKGEVFWADLNPTLGSEINKTRPVVIVSNNINNHYSETVTILPITSSTAKIYPFEVFVPAGMVSLKNDSKIKANQIRTIDKQRIKQFLGTLPLATINAIDKAIAVHLNLKIDL